MQQATCRTLPIAERFARARLPPRVDAASRAAG
jgi:hypothetical protein